MNAATLIPKKLLSSADVYDAKGRAVSKSAVISGLQHVEVGTEKEVRPALSFEGTGRMLTLNVTNIERLVELFGGETDDWIGQTISLNGDTAKYGGKTVNAIRVDGPVAGAPSAFEVPV